MAKITLYIDDEETDAIKKYARSKGLRVNTAIYNAIMEKVEQAGFLLQVYKENDANQPPE